MKFINRCRRTVLLSVLCFSTVFSSPVFAAENPDITPEIRYNMEIQSNAWENWPKKSLSLTMLSIPLSITAVILPETKGKFLQ